MALPFPVPAPITSTVLFWIPLKEIFHLVLYPNRQSAITGNGCDSFHTISGTGLCHFWYGHSLGAVPKLGSMRMVPFPVRGSASSGTVIHWAPYQNWTLLMSSLAGALTSALTACSMKRDNMGCWASAFKRGWALPAGTLPPASMVDHLFSQKNEMIKWDPVIYEPHRLWLHWSVGQIVWFLWVDLERKPLRRCPSKEAPQKKPIRRIPSFSCDAK